MRDFGKISWRIWRSQKFRQCSDSAQLTYLNLHTNPDCTSVGIITTTPAHIAADRCRDAHQVTVDLQSLHDCGLIIWDQNEELILITQFLSPHFNPIMNPKHGMGALRSLAHIKNEVILMAVLTQILQYERKLRAEDIADAKKAISRLKNEQTELNQHPYDTGMDTESKKREGYVHRDRDREGEGDMEQVSDEPPPQPQWLVLGPKLLALTGLDQSIRPVPFQIIQQWLADWTEEIILAAVQEVVSRPGYKTPGGLKYFEPAIRKKAETTVDAQAATWRANTATFDDEKWWFWLNRAANGERWLAGQHGPAPGERGCIVPERILDQYRAKYVQANVA